MPTGASLAGLFQQNLDTPICTLRWPFVALYADSWPEAIVSELANIECLLNHSFGLDVSPESERHQVQNAHS